MGWFSSNKPKKQEVRLKNGILEADPFQQSIVYTTRKTFKFERAKGFFTRHECEFTIQPIYLDHEDIKSWGLRIKTYRSLKASSLDKMEKLINTEPQWRTPKDFRILADGQPIKTKTHTYEAKYNRTDTNRKAWGGGHIEIEFEDFKKITDAKKVEMRYYGSCDNSEFDLSDAECKRIVKLIPLVFVDEEKILDFKFEV